MKIDVFGLTEGENRVHFSEEAAVLDLPGELQAQTSVEVNAVVTKRGAHLVLKGDATCTLNMECSRCLQPFWHRLQARLEVFYMLGGKRADDREDDDVIRIAHSDQEVDLAGKVREAMLLAIPIKPLCREECKGLCPRCGVNRNRGECGCITRTPDPRLAVLRDLCK